MILGFTGTRNLPTRQQHRTLNLFMFDNDIDQAHHGACVGSDLAFHGCALNYGVPIVVHPPLEEAYLAWECLTATHEVYEPEPDITVLERKEYHERNRDIVHACDNLLATPNGPRRPHSGTWYTIDYALKHKVPVVICWPDGTLEKI